MGSSQSYFDRNLSKSKGDYSFSGLHINQGIPLKYRVTRYNPRWAMSYLFRYNLNDLSNQQNLSVTKLCECDIGFYNRLIKHNGCYVTRETNYLNKLPIFNSVTDTIVPFEMEIMLYRNRVEYTCHSRFGTVSTTHTCYHDNPIPELCWMTDLELSVDNDNVCLTILHNHKANRPNR